MARRYYLNVTNSDLTGGSPFNKYLFPNNTGTLTSVSVAPGAGVTLTSYGFTPPNHPGLYGATGNYTISVDMTTVNANLRLSVRVNRINSAGTVQTAGTATAEITPVVGANSFAISAANLGTWASTDRLRIDYIFRNNSTMTAITVGIDTSSPDNWALTPFDARVSTCT